MLVQCCLLCVKGQQPMWLLSTHTHNMYARPYACCLCAHCTPQHAGESRAREHTATATSKKHATAAAGRCSSSNHKTAPHPGVTRKHQHQEPCCTPLFLLGCICSHTHKDEHINTHTHTAASHHHHLLHATDDASCLPDAASTAASVSGRLVMVTSSTIASAASFPLKIAPSMEARYFCLV